MTFGDYKILTALHMVPWWVLGAFASIALFNYLVTPLQFMDHLLAQGIGVLAIALLLFKVTDKSFRILHQWWQDRPTSFKSLTNQQKNFLLEIFHTGSRSTKIHTDDSNQRWFEALEEMNYIELNVGPVMFISDDGYSTYYVTSKGWKKIERYVKKST